MDAKRRRSADDPPTGERAGIARRIKLLALYRRDRPGVVDWPGIAGRLAEQLAVMTTRLAGDPEASAGDHEHVMRARDTLRDYKTARAADSD